MAEVRPPCAAAARSSGDNGPAHALPSIYNTVERYPVSTRVNASRDKSPRAAVGVAEFPEAYMIGPPPDRQ